MSLSHIENIVVPRMGLPLMRYIGWDAFVHLIKTKQLFFKNCVHYEEHDELEGKATDDFKNVIARAQKIESRRENPNNEDIDGLMTYEQATNYRFSLLDISRQHTYISCWTNAEQENQYMWKTFGNKGVLLKSTLGNICESLDSFKKSGKEIHGYSQFEVVHAPVSYNRKKMHYDLTLKNYEDNYFPIFNLDSRGDFPTQSEYRFAIKDREKTLELEREAIYASAGNRKFQLRSSPEILKVGFDPRLILSIVYSSKSLKESGIKLLHENGFSIPCSVSKMAAQIWIRGELRYRKPVQLAFDFRGVRKNKKKSVLWKI